MPQLLVASGLIKPSKSYLLRIASVSLPRRHQSTKASPTTLTCSISAAYSAKRAPLDPVNNLFHHDSSSARVSPAQNTRRSHLLPPKNARPKTGEDAYFISEISGTDSIAFGVVDGVGGWSQSGVDPADFAHAICGHMKIAAQSFDGIAPVKQRRKDPRTQNFEETAAMRPLDLLHTGYEKVLQDGSVWAGGSTACIATASSDGVLEVANLGDSGYAHIAPFRISHLSKVQQHEFNTPFQLSKVPSRVRRQMQLFGSTHYEESPSDADIYSHSVNHGDVVILATDGVWDNLSAQDVLDIVCGVMVRFKGWVLGEGGGVKVGNDLLDIAEDCLPRKSNLGHTADPSSLATGKLALSSVLASSIVKEAKEASVNKNRESPFGKALKQAYPYETWRGGKVDDICVVASLVLEK